MEAAGAGDDAVQLRVRLLGDREVLVEASARDSVAALRERLLARELRAVGPARRLRLIFLGRLLRGPEVLGAALGGRREAVLHCVVSEGEARFADEDNDPAGRTVPLTPEEALREDRRFAERLQREAIGQYSEQLRGQRQQLPLQQQQRRRGARGGEDEQGGAEPDDANPLTFFVAFVAGFVLGAFSLLVSFRLTRKQMLGLLSGVWARIVIDVLTTLGDAHDEAAKAHEQEVERLDRFGNVLPGPGIPSLRGAAVGEPSLV